MGFRERVHITPHHSMEIQYDPDLGYPRRVYVAPQQNVADDEYGFVIEGFRPLARQ
jgi:hypothetical protein